MFLVLTEMAMGGDVNKIMKEKIKLLIFWFKDNWFKIASLAVILVVGFGYINHLNTKELNERNALARAEIQRLESEQKKYIAEQKSSCLQIYTTESDKWGNVRGWRFSEEDDACYIRYKDPDPKTEVECNENYSGTDGKVLSFFWRLHALCLEGEFENSF